VASDFADPQDARDAYAGHLLARATDSGAWLPRLAAA
jgi:hypothetical protein